MRDVLYSDMQRAVFSNPMSIGIIIILFQYVFGDPSVSGLRVNAIIEYVKVKLWRC